MRRIRWFFAFALLCTCPAWAGSNSGGTATLSWDSTGVVTNLSSVPGGQFPLFVTLSGAPDIRELAIWLQWTPDNLVGPCYYVLPDSENTGSCGWSSSSPPGGPFAGDSSYVWSIGFPSGVQKNCVVYTVAGEHCDSVRASFCLKSVVTMDSFGALDTLLVSGGATLLGGDTLACPGDPDTSGTNLLARQVPGPSSTPITGSALATVLRAQRLPVSFILAATETPVAFASRTLSLRAVLDRLVAVDTSYAYAVLRGRLVIFPRDRRLSASVTLPAAQLTAAPRLLAATRYVGWLRSNASGFSDLGRPPMKGNPYAPAYTAPVTLSPTAPVVRHLVELLGNDTTLVFAIVRARSGHPCLTFYSTASGPPARSSAARGTARSSRGAGPARVETAYCDASAIVTDNNQLWPCTTSGTCGIVYVYDIKGVTYTGCDCDGCDITETIYDGGGCDAGGGIPSGMACPLMSGGIINPNALCQDRVGYCDWPENFAPGECIDTYYQTAYVCGRPVEDFTYTFDIYINDDYTCGWATVTQDIAGYYTPPTCDLDVAPVNQQGLILAEPRPNPASGVTRIAFDLPTAMRGNLAVFDVAGRRIRTLADGQLAAGVHSVTWNVDVHAGVYFLRLLAGSRVISRVLVVRQ